MRDSLKIDEHEPAEAAPNVHPKRPKYPKHRLHEFALIRFASLQLQRSGKGEGRFLSQHVNAY